jgi:hypothetical protein
MIGDPEDPILLAGAVRCAGCGRMAYPVDAAWLTDQLMLVTFAQPHRAECRGPRAWIMIMDITMASGQVFTHAPTGNARRAREYYKRNSCRACGILTGARYCAACRCQAQTARGRRCVNRAGPGGFCGVHPAVGELPDGISGCRPRTARRPEGTS